jgi:polyisoprenoid-binding protein YceI
MASTSAGTTTATGRDNPPPGIYLIDPTHSKVQFMVQHMMISRVRGHFNTFAGTIAVASEPERSTADATIEAASIDTGDENRDNHLRSADFLDVAHYPEIRWASTGIRRAGDGWEVDGDLTIRDMTKPVTLTVRYMGTPLGRHPARLRGHVRAQPRRLGRQLEPAAGGGQLPCGQEGPGGAGHRSRPPGPPVAVAVCDHVGYIQPVVPSCAGCEDCLRAGRRDWVHLRLCVTCGHVGCCDSSPARHARRHAYAAGHPIVRSFERGEDWYWCYIDEVMFEIEGAPASRTHR